MCGAARLHSAPSACAQCCTQHHHRAAKSSSPTPPTTLSSHVLPGKRAGPGSRRAAGPSGPAAAVCQEGEERGGRMRRKRENWRNKVGGRRSRASRGVRRGASMMGECASCGQFGRGMAAGGGVLAAVPLAARCLQDTMQCQNAAKRGTPQHATAGGERRNKQPTITS